MTEYFDGELEQKDITAIVKLAKAGKLQELREYLFDLQIHPRTADLFILAMSEDERLEKLIKGAEGARQKVAECEERIEILNRTPNVDPDTLFTKRSELRQQASELRAKASESDTAAVHRRGIRQRFPELFGVSMVGDGDKAHWPPATSAPSPAIVNELWKLGLPTEHVVDPWRCLGSTGLVAVDQLKTIPSPISAAAAE